MSFADGLRAARVRKLHGEFLRAAAQYARLFHIAVHCNVEDIHRALCFSWTRAEFESALERDAYTCFRDNVPSEHGDCLPDIRFRETSRLNGPSEVYAAVWHTAICQSRHREKVPTVVNPESGHPLFRFRTVGAQPLQFDSLLWAGRYFGPAKTLGPVEYAKPGNPTKHDGEEDFRRLAEEAMADFGHLVEAAQHPPPTKQRDAVARWLELLYGLFPQEPEALMDGLFLVVGHPWNVFSTSARALESLSVEPSTPDGVSVLTEGAQAVYDYLMANPYKFAKEIATATGVPKGTITLHHVPTLRAYGLRNRRGRGYYLEGE